MVRVFYIVDISTLKFKKIYSSPAYNFRMSFGENLLIVDKGKMSFGAKGLSRCKWLMLFFADVLSVDKGKMSFLTEGLPDGKARMSFTANALTVCHLEEPFDTRY